MSKTITIIQLLNKIANGEEVPKKIKYEDIVFIWNGAIYHHFDEDDCIHESLSDYLHIAKSDLNIVVEIIEDEQKIDIQSIEELENNYTYYEDLDGGTTVVEKVLNKAEKDLFNKINQLVQAVKYLDNKIKEK